MDDSRMTTVDIPCGHPYFFAGCHFCELADKDIRYAKLFNRNREPRNPEEKKQLTRWQRVHLPCPHRGEVLERSQECGCPHVYSCSLKGRVVKIGTHKTEPNLPQCYECEHHPDG